MKFMAVAKKPPPQSYGGQAVQTSNEKKSSRQTKEGRFATARLRKTAVTNRRSLVLQRPAI
jgi:hypothetical protein